MKKVLNIIYFIFVLLLGTFVLTGCRQEKEVVYEKDGFYLPTETQGYEVSQAVLFGNGFSSKAVFAENEEELNDLLTLFCAKKPKYIGTMSQNKFLEYYLKGKNEGFNLSINFVMPNTSKTLSYDFYITQKGVIFFGKNASNTSYKYTEENFGDYEAVSQYYGNWHR